MQITFTYPGYLWFLLSIPLLALTHFFVLRFVKKKAMRFANFDVLERVISSGEHGIRHTHFISKNILLLVTRLAVVALIVLAISGMVFWYEGNIGEFDYVLAIDASSSMLADDLNPTRFDVAKRSAKSFLDSINYRSNVGLVKFAGVSEIVSPVTSSIDELKEEIDSLKISLKSGTDLTEAIFTSINLLPPYSGKKGVIILITDGRSTVGEPVRVGISYALNNDVTVHTIGVGSREGGSFMKGGISQLDEESLKEIAEKTGGNYYRASSPDSLDMAFKEISKIEKGKIDVQLSPLLMFIALTMLFMEWGLINTKYRTFP